MGNPNLAEDYYKSALHLAREIELTYIYCYLYKSLADLAIQNKDFSQAQKYVDSAYVCAQPNCSVEIIVPINILQSSIYTSTGKPQKAIDLLNKSLKLSSDTKYLESKTHILKKLSAVYKSEGNYQQALSYHEQAQINSDNLNVSSVLENMINIELEYEFEKAESIKKLKQEKSEMKAQTRIKTSHLISCILAIMLLFLLSITIILISNIHLRKKRNIILREKNAQIEKQKNELNAMVEKLVKMTHELEESNATKDKLFSIIGHDLRSPFNAICGFSRLLLMEEPKKDQRQQYYNIIYDSSVQLVNMVDRLLTWSRNQMGMISFEKTEFYIGNAIMETLKMNKMMVEKKSISLIPDFNISEDLPVLADQNMINIILQNLIANAFKYTSEQGQIHVGFNKKGAKVTLFVRDTGIGMSQEEILHITHSMIVQSKQGTKGEKGTGLGLNICKEFIAKHNSKLLIESKEGQGSKFSFEIDKA